MPEEQQEGSARDATRLGGAAADFVGGLGRKVGELRAAIGAIGAIPEAKDRERGRDEVRRKLHALGVGARLLHFEVLSKAIGAATEHVDEETTRGEVSDELLAELGTLLDRIPDLVWAKHVLTPTPPPIGLDPFEPDDGRAPEESGALPWTVVVVGDEALAQAVAADPGLFPCDVERIADPPTALEIARLVAPELLLVDVELPGAIDLVEALFEDSATSALPLLAYGSPEDESGSARLVALGVTRIIHRGTSAAELRAECAAQVEAARAPAKEVLHPDLGELTVAQLADRLADEVRRALTGDVAPEARSLKVPLGVGAEILGPMWGALARVRDVVAAKSGGNVAFENHAGHSALATSIAAEPEIPVEVLLTPTPPPIASPRRPRARAEGADVDLSSRILVVADDDPQVLWFIGDVLRQAGALVLEAKDGQEALALARGSGADAIITDVLMPRVDGLTLARTLRRDVALRDRPIIMLSWKEDLLKRLRDLRMESQVMLRKEADGRTILARVREVLTPRARVEARIAAGGEVRGRLDDLSIASLVEIVNRVRREAQLVVRDAANVYEIELDGGGIRSLARVSTDGVKTLGPAILPSLLGVVGGRFLVRPLPKEGSSPRDLEGDLAAQLTPVLRKLRAACDAVSGARTIEVARVQLDDGQLGAYLRAMPQPMRGLLERIAGGASPRGMMLGVEVAPATLEDVLLDVASRGLVTRVTSSSGDDLLALADKALDGPPAPLVDKPRPAPKPAPAPETDAFDLAPSIAPPPSRPDPEPDVAEGSPASLTDAVLQASAPGERNSLSRTLIDTRELKPRSVRSDPPPGGAARPASNPPDARTSSPPEKPRVSATPTPAPVVATKPKDEHSDTLAGLGIDRLGAKEEPKSPESAPEPVAAKVESAPEAAPTAPEKPEKKDEPRTTTPREPKDQILEDLARERTWTRRRSDQVERASARDTAADDRIAARRRRARDRDDDDDDDLDDVAPKRGRRGVEREAGPPTKERTEAARKQLKSDGAFWWIVLALGVIGASIAFAIQQRDESEAKRKAAASAQSAATAPSSPPKPPTPAPTKSGP